jgi:hypothetical protein
MHRRRKGAPMNRILVAVGVCGALVLPAGAAASPSGTDRENAAKECRTKKAFDTKYGTNENDANAFGKCVSTRARDEEAERHASKRAARHACASRKHGKGHAYGRCVKSKTKAFEERADSEDRREIESEHSSARACAQERDQMGSDAFAEKYGTNRNKRNAFGKCVSKMARS